MNLRQAVEEKVGQVTNEEMQFSLTNLNLEIEYKFQSMPSHSQMVEILLANIEFYRKYNQIMQNATETVPGSVSL